MSNKIIWLIVILFILIIGGGIFGYIYYNKYQDINTKLQTSQLLVTQNEKYYEEILKQKDDSLQILSGLVLDLNTEKEKIEGEYTAQVSNLKLKIKSIEDKGESIATEGKDKEGDYLDIPFSGKKSIATYNGYTRHYYESNKSFWWVNIDFDPIDVFSQFYIDNEGVWRIKTTSLTPGIVLNTDYKIDSTFYSTFKNTNSLLSKEEESLWKFKVKAGIIGSWHTNDFYRKNPVFVSAELNYDFFYTEYSPLHKYVIFGVEYDLTSSFNIIKHIFSIF